MKGRAQLCTSVYRGSRGLLVGLLLLLLQKVRCCCCCTETAERGRRQ